MHALYFKALLRLVLLLGLSIVVAYLCVSRSYHQEALLGPAQDGFSWHLSSRSVGGADTGSMARPESDQSRVIMDFVLADGVANSYAATKVVFTDRKGTPKLLDFSKFGRISFEARCFPSNTLLLSVATFDKTMSKPDDLLTYRSPSAFFDCTPDGSRIDIDLTHMTIPQWWFDLFKVNPSQQGYRLDQVAQIEFGTSNRSRTGVPSRVEIADIELHGRQYAYLYFLAAFLACVWGGFGVWFFRQYAIALSTDLQARMQKDLPLVAYQQLSLEPHRDKEKRAILKLLATRYADPELDLETVISETGANRNKINDILKAELGYTFSAYVNKLRLTEASRLLADNANASVAEIAYSVGYKNVSYFNKLFKEEYHCTPKAFREIYTKNAQQTPSA
jgi:AraC-like DNA-binding protein